MERALANEERKRVTCSVPGGGDLTRVSVGIIIGRLMGGFRPGGIMGYTHGNVVCHKSDTLGRGSPVTRFIRQPRVYLRGTSQIVSPILHPRVRRVKPCTWWYVRSVIRRFFFPKESNSCSVFNKSLIEEFFWNFFFFFHRQLLYIWYLVCEIGRSRMIIKSWKWVLWVDSCEYSCEFRK